jgi:tetratricopeptide (TPR) repeat protein
MKNFVLLSIIGISAVLFTGCGSSATSDTLQQSDAPINAADITDANTALAEGTRLLDTGETETAIEVLNRAVELNPDLGEAYFKLGIAYSLVEFRDQTGLGGERTPESTPLPGETKAPRKKRNSEIAFEKAVAAYKKWTEANPEDDTAFFNLGRAYNKLNEDEDAAKALRQAVKLKPEDSEYQTELGDILIKLAKYHEAVGALKKALEIDPSNSQAEDLLEQAEAGRKRIEYVTLPKDEKKDDKSANSNANTSVGSSNSTAPSNTKPPETKSTRPSTNKPR